MPPPSTRAALANVTVENTDALHCGVCCLPLKPPIFLVTRLRALTHYISISQFCNTDIAMRKSPMFCAQCDQGHFMCSSCRDELEALRPELDLCDYRRCDAMEKLVESIRVPCPNAAYGCDTTATYYGHRDHLERCPHRPCRCPVESCGFTAGSMTSLPGHLTSIHDWPRTNLEDSVWDDMYLRDGCNALDVVDGAGGKHLLVLTVSRERLGRAISITCVHNGAYPCCKLKLSTSRGTRRPIVVVI
jgi:E3 ubiquitin-protein ligase SIAH1